MLVCSWWSVVYLVKMKCRSQLNPLLIFFRILFSVIDAFLNLWDWIICWHIFNKFSICFENNNFKCTQCCSVDGNTNWEKVWETNEWNASVWSDHSWNKYVYYCRKTTTGTVGIVRYSKRYVYYSKKTTTGTVGIVQYSKRSKVQ